MNCKLCLLGTKPNANEGSKYFGGRSRGEGQSIHCNQRGDWWVPELDTHSHPLHRAFPKVLFITMQDSGGWC